MSKGKSELEVRRFARTVVFGLVAMVGEGIKCNSTSARRYNRENIGFS